MTIDEILQLPDFKKAVDIPITYTSEDRNKEEYLKEYKGDRSCLIGDIQKTKTSPIFVKQNTFFFQNSDT